MNRRSCKTYENTVKSLKSAQSFTKLSSGLVLAGLIRAPGAYV